jgi:protein-histidine N-methyltransferase
VQLGALPSLISYSPLVVPLYTGRKTDLAPSLTLARRDLFDARFQLISEGAKDETNAAVDSGKETKAKALQFLDAPSDLVTERVRSRARNSPEHYTRMVYVCPVIFHF